MFFPLSLHDQLSFSTSKIKFKDLWFPTVHPNIAANHSLESVTKCRVDKVNGITISSINTLVDILHDEAASLWKKWIFSYLNVNVLTCWTQTVSFRVLIQQPEHRSESEKTPKVMLAWFLMTVTCIQTETPNEGTQAWAALPEDSGGHSVKHNPAGILRRVEALWRSESVLKCKVTEPFQPQTYTFVCTHANTDQASHGHINASKEQREGHSKKILRTLSSRDSKLTKVGERAIFTFSQLLRYISQVPLSFLSRGIG